MVGLAVLAGLLALMALLALVNGAGIGIFFAASSAGLFVILVRHERAERARKESEERNGSDAVEERKLRRQVEIEADAREKARAKYRRDSSASERPAERRLEVREKIVERHILVMRCKFCGKLTPADLSKCESCGSVGFA